MKTATKVQLFFHICKFFFTKVNFFSCAPAAGGGARGRMGAAWCRGWRWGGYVGRRVGGWGGFWADRLGGVCVGWVAYGVVVWVAFGRVYFICIACVWRSLSLLLFVVLASFQCRLCVVLSSFYILAMFEPWSIYTQTIVYLCLIYVLYIIIRAAIFTQIMLIFWLFSVILCCTTYILLLRICLKSSTFAGELLTLLLLIL